MSKPKVQFGPSGRAYQIRHYGALSYIVELTLENGAVVKEEQMNSPDGGIATVKVMERIIRKRVAEIPPEETSR